nr:hypothetical protein [Comamonas jiangduensis]
MRELLQEHMELQRYRQLSDLRRSELGRLLGAADANIRSLLGTMGYFSPSIELQLIDTLTTRTHPQSLGQGGARHTHHHCTGPRGLQRHQC